MANVDIYTLKTCPYCIRAKQLLDSKGVIYQEFRVDEKPELAAHLDTEAIKRYTEAKRIFELLEELDTTPCYTWGELAKQRIEICEMAINLRTRRLSDSSS